MAHIFLLNGSGLEVTIGENLIDLAKIFLNRAQKERITRERKKDKLDLPKLKSFAF